eukprot:TRINITY_DN13197_c0_g2_i1.p1 TRINITY_DN13197_c0_g2~~TRINITY_DN13197_c0_g2_i1.p1  ORF type:complete len:220 (-),score=40.56 TRINITY_DN13197_c0_g2_i1:128-787(-)
MSLSQLLPEISECVKLGTIGQDTLWSKMQRALRQARKTPQEFEHINAGELADMMTYILIICVERPAFRKQAVAALVTLLESPDGFITFANVPGKDRLQLWKLPVVGSKGDGFGSAELAAKLIGSGCSPDELLKPASEVLEYGKFAKELLTLFGGDKEFCSTEVGKALLAAEFVDDDEGDKPKRQVVGGNSSFDASGGKIVQVEVVNGMAKAAQASGVKF